MLPSNQQIKFTLIIDAQDSLAKSSEITNKIAAIKQEMVALQNQSGATFRELARGMKKAADEAVALLKVNPSNFMTPDPNDPTKQIMTPFNQQQLAQAQANYNAAKKQAAEYKAYVSAASQELTKQEAEQQKIRISNANQAAKEQILISKEMTKELSLADQRLNQLEIIEARETAKQYRQSRLDMAKSDTERAAIAKQSAMEAKQAYEQALLAEATARKNLVVALQGQIVSPGPASNALVENTRAAVAEATQEVAVTKALSQDAVQHQRAIETANSRMATSFLRLGTALKTVFMGGLAFGIINFFMQLPALINKATEAAVEFSKVQLSIAVGLREMRRRGGEAPMFQDVMKQIEELTKRFKGLYSEMDLTEAYAVSISKLGRLGFTFKDINKVVETSALLAQLNDKTLKDTSSALATYLNSGVSQGLENSGIVAGRAADKFVAFEEGLKSATLDGINPAEKALMRLGFVGKQIDPQLEELAGRPKIIANSWDEASNSVAMSTIKAGQAFAPFVIKFKQGWAWILDGLVTWVIPALQKGFEIILGMIGQFAGSTTYVFGSMYEQIRRFSKGEALIGIEEFWKGFDDAAKKGSEVATASIKKDFIEGSQAALESWANEDVDVLGPLIPDEGDSAKFKDFWTDLFTQINKLIVDYGRDVADAWEKYKQKLQEIEDEYNKKLLDAEIDFQNKLADLARKNQQNIEDEYRKYQQSIEDTNREYQQKLQDAQREYRDNEIKAEEEFQKKLKRLREDFLFDLEDAVRERDARQIMSLIKRYNMQRERLIEDFQDEKSEREKNYRDQLEEIRIWRERRLQELAIEHQRRLEEIAIQYAREKEEAARNYEEALQAAADWRKQAQEDAKTDYERELEDLKQHFADRLTEIITSLMEEKDIQTEYAKAIAGLIKKTFGKNGIIEKDFSNFNDMIDESVQKAVDAINTIKELEAQLQIPETDTVTPTTPTTPPVSGSKQRNVPDNPNSGSNHGISEFGSVGGLLPVGSIGSIIQPSMNPSPSLVTPAGLMTTANGDTSSAKIQIYLSDGLQADILENTMQNLIEVISQIRN